MSTDSEIISTHGGSPAKTYSVYAAGEIFTQHDLAANVLLKDTVWSQSNGKFALILPQSKELRLSDRQNVAAYIRNVDLVQTVKADIFLARFDGLELDAGTVVEFMLAKFLGKPAVILRCDSRRMGGESLDEPYNLMVKNWPRTVEVHFDSLMNYIGEFANEAETLEDMDHFQTVIRAEMKIVMKGIDEIARKLIQGLETVLGMKSPYPDAYQETVYQIARYCPGSGFDQLISEQEMEGLVKDFRKTGIL